MRRFALTMIGLLLAFSIAEATVYVWEDADALVMTNDQTKVPERLDPEEMKTYATAATAGPERPERLATVRADGTTEPAEAEEPDRGPGPAGVVASAATQPPPPETAPRAAGASGPAPSGGARADATDKASLGGWRVDPRALFERKREPPQFIVSVVEPSAGPLSTSLRETRPSISETGSSGVNAFRDER
jgi:hypothetical protein